MILAHIVAGVRAGAALDPEARAQRIDRANARVTRCARHYDSLAKKLK